MSSFFIRPASPLPTITWSQLTKAGDAINDSTAEHALHYDPVSGQIYVHGSDGGIYSNGLWFGAISGSTITLTKRSGTGGGSAPCYSDGTGWVSQSGGYNIGDGSALFPNFLADRHPEVMNAYDSFRRKIFQWSGLACGNPVVGDGLGYRDLWQIDLNAIISSVTMQQITLGALPNIYVTAAMAYVPSHDVLVLTGQGGPAAVSNEETWVLSRSTGAPQTAAGATSADTWFRTWNPGTTTPAHGLYPQAVCDPINAGRVLLFKQTGVVNPWTSRVWAYDVPGKSWSELSIVNAPSNVRNGDWPKQTVAVITAGTWANKVLYLSTMDGPGSGANYWLFNVVTNRFDQLSANVGPQHGLSYGCYAPNVGAQGAWIVYENNVGFWKGLLS